MSSSTSASTSLSLSSSSLSGALSLSTKKQQSQQQRRQVLIEEEYTSTLETIVQRDFFPEIPELEKQAALLQKRSSGDVAGAVAIRRAARQLQQQEESLAELERQQEQDLVSHGKRVVPRPLHRETVSGFHARVTSQDNHHFEQTQKAELQHQQHTLEQVFDNNNSNNNSNKSLLALTKDGQQQEGQQQSQSSESPFLLASDRFNPTPNQLQLTSTTTTSQKLAQQPSGTNPRNNGLFFSPPSFEESLYHQPKHSSKQQNVEYDGKLSHSSSETTKRIPTTSSSISSLMPPPPPVSVTTSKNRMLSSSNKNHTTATSPSATTNNEDLSSSVALSTLSSTRTIKFPSHNLNLVEYIPKSSMVKRIEPSQTRFPPSSLSTLTRRPSNHFQYPENNDSSSSVTTTDYSTTTDLDETPQRSIQAERQARSKRLKREQETLLQMTPLIEPGHRKVANPNDPNDDDDSAASPIITWGTVASTPMVLGGGDNYIHTAKMQDESTSFRLPQENAREEAVRQTMIQKEQEKKKQQQKQHQEYRASNNTTKKNTPLDRSIANLTPAARSLLSRTTTAKTSILASSSATGRSSVSSSSCSSKLISARSKDAFASALRSSYSSTPQQRLRRHSKGSSSTTPNTSSSVQRKRNLASKATPLQSRKSTKSTSTILQNTLASATSTSARSERHHTTSKKRNMTDGLLQLPK